MLSKVVIFRQKPQVTFMKSFIRKQYNNSTVSPTISTCYFSLSISTSFIIYQINRSNAVGSAKSLPSLKYLSDKQFINSLKQKFWSWRQYLKYLRQSTQINIKLELPSEKKLTTMFKRKLVIINNTNGCIT